MLFYAIAGLWFGYAFIVIALCTTALTLIGYYYVGAAFLLWMAVVAWRRARPRRPLDAPD